MPDTAKTEIAVILDRSGSMERIRDDMIGGFKTFVDGHRGDPGQCVLSLYQFDAEFEVVYEARPLHEVRDLQLDPRGNTALFDAAGKAITLIAERHARQAEDDRPETVIVIIITDGHENSSKEWTLEGVRGAVIRSEEQHGWHFVFLGADPASFDEARDMGIGTVRTFRTTREGVASAYSILLDESRSRRRPRSS